MVAALVNLNGSRREVGRPVAVPIRIHDLGYESLQSDRLAASIVCLYSDRPLDFPASLQIGTRQPISLP